jgi:uncharacterized Zn-binding protein involved in type VI secretion
MPAAARGSSTDSVSTGHGCDATTVTDACSGDVFVNGKGSVRFGDAVHSHLYPVGPSCVPHAPTMSENCSSTVFINGKKAAFKGSKYSGHEITSGSGNVFIGA